MLSLDDTIVAIASPPGRAARGIVRLSGPQALTLVSSMLAGAEPPAHGFRRARGTWRRGQSSALPVEVYFFRGPHSFTGQDCAEIHTLGSPVILGMILAQLLEAGARPAEPGEFTSRAFLSGRIDLTRAEAVAQVIQARSEGQLRAARRLLDGALAARVNALRDKLAELAALVEADIDFAEEPIEFITPAVLRGQLSEIRGDLQRLLSDAHSSQRLDTVPRVLLVGRPNAGKSSLLNALSGVDRAICSAVAGTTRDILSAPIRLPRGEALLLDAAGIDESLDPVLSLAREHVRAAAVSADLVCLVIDGATASRQSPAEWRADFRALQNEVMVTFSEASSALTILNKVDLLTNEQVATCITAIDGRAACAVSALTGAGLETLRSLIEDRLNLSETPVSADAIHLTIRQAEAIRSALGSIGGAVTQTAGIAETAQAADLIAFDLREALDALGAISGAVTTEDLLTRIFSSFCIGK